jgi:RES domain-containing protein
MELWRICSFPDLSGVGGSRAGGRWHSQGRRIIYLADRPAVALSEMLGQMDRDLIPATCQLLHLVLPDQTSIANVKDLPPDWRTQTMLTRKIGDAWLAGARSALLLVPSAVNQQNRYLLLNPAHPDAAKVTVAEIIRAPFDARLFG